MATYTPLRGAELDIRNGERHGIPTRKINPAVFVRPIQQYLTRSPINQDGRLIPAGELLDLPRSEAEPLLLDGAIEPFIRRFDEKINVAGADMNDRR